MDATSQATVGAEVWPPCGLHYCSWLTVSQTHQPGHKIRKRPPFSCLFWHPDIFRKTSTLLSLERQFSILSPIISLCDGNRLNQQVIKAFQHRRNSFPHLCVSDKISEYGWIWRDDEGCMTWTPKRLLSSSFLLPHFLQSKRQSEGKQSAGEEMPQHFLSRKQCLLQWPRRGGTGQAAENYGYEGHRWEREVP